MAGQWVTVFGALIAPALVVAVSPFSILAGAALVLHNHRPRRAGVAFLAGRMVALAALAAVFVQVPRLLDALDRPTPDWAPWAWIVGGVLLTVSGVWLWRRREAMSAEPRWLSRTARITPAGAAVIGVAFVVTNPKMVAATAAAGVLIGAAGIGVTGAGAAVAYYTVVASSTVAVPVLAYVAAGERVEAPLARFRQWIQRHQITLGAAILVLVGIALVLGGIGQL